MITTNTRLLLLLILAPCISTAASFGGAFSETASQINLSNKMGDHVVIGGVNFYESGKKRARTRYFNMQDGLSYTGDIIFDANFTVATAGVMYNISFDSGWIVSPMLAAGYNPYRDPSAVKSENGTAIAQPGLFLQWNHQKGRFYMNPKSTYFNKDKAWVSQLELGADMNIGKQFSAGLKWDWTDKSILTPSGSSTLWLRTNYTF
ncbi:hypothetical protein [Vibrio maritimus]|uniref:hypothetical protein n=1 Tax=Vibrio maritimus TaxID=990268 RepID=UPI003735D6AB